MAVVPIRSRAQTPAAPGEVVMVPLNTIDSNPMRIGGNYPYNETKIAELRHSIRDVGLWAGVTGRRVGNRVQLAFGHHRTEAARRELGVDESVPLVIRELTDEQMVQFFGRENLEDYHADFPILMQAWLMGRKFIRETDRGSPRGEPHSDEKTEEQKIAKVLGWSRAPSKGKYQNKTNHRAEACARVAVLIDDPTSGLTLDDFADMDVAAVIEFAAGMVREFKAADDARTEEGERHPPEVIQKAREIVVEVGRNVATQIRGGGRGDERVTTRQIRGEISYQVHNKSRRGRQAGAMANYDVFVRAQQNAIMRYVLDDTSIAKNLQRIVEQVAYLDNKNDIALVTKLAEECANAADRLRVWQRKLKSAADRQAATIRPNRKRVN